MTRRLSKRRARLLQRRVNAAIRMQQARGMSPRDMGRRADWMRGWYAAHEPHEAWDVATAVVHTLRRAERR